MCQRLFYFFGLVNISTLNVMLLVIRYVQWNLRLLYYLAILFTSHMQLFQDVSTVFDFHVIPQMAFSFICPFPSSFLHLSGLSHTPLDLPDPVPMAFICNYLFYFLFRWRSNPSSNIILYIQLLWLYELQPAHQRLNSYRPLIREYRPYQPFCAWIHSLRMNFFYHPFHLSSNSMVSVF